MQTTNVSIFLRFFVVWLCVAYSVLVRLHSVCTQCEIAHNFVLSRLAAPLPVRLASFLSPLIFSPPKLSKLPSLLQMRFSPEGKTPGKNWPPRKEEVYDTPQEWLRRIGRARVQRERESNARNDLHADSDRRVESPKASIPLGMGVAWTQMQI